MRSYFCFAGAVAAAGGYYGVPGQAAAAYGPGIYQKQQGHHVAAFAGIDRQLCGKHLYDKKGFFSGRYGDSQAILNGHLVTVQAMQGAPSRLAEIFAVFGLLALIAIGHFSGNPHGAEFVTLGAFLAAAYKIIPGISRLLNLTGQMRPMSSR
jgi:hypothetical protein